MKNKDSNEILFSYFSEKERAIAQRLSLIQHNKISNKNKNNKNNSDNNNENKSTTLSPDTIIDENENKTINSISKVGYDNKPVPVSAPINQENSSPSRYDNESNQSLDTKISTPKSTSPTTTATTTITTRYDNSPNQSPQIVTVRYDNASNQSPQIVPVRYDNAPTNIDSSSNGYSSYEAQHGSSGSSNIVSQTSSGIGISSSSGSGNNNSYSYSYSGESFNSGTSSFSSSVQTYSIYSDEEESDRDEYSDYSGGSKKKKNYNNTDITEEDLLLLESLIKYKSTFGITAEENDSETQQTDITDSTITNNNNNNNNNNASYVDGQYAFKSTYSHPKFLTEKGLQDSTTQQSNINNSTNEKNQNQQPIQFNNISLKSWNEEFQRLLNMDDCLEKFEKLSSLEHDFVYAAETYGKIIISENFLAKELKTIKPVNVGGIAGGEKYIVQGILFKFALETFGLYGNDENAMKTAAHELNACAALLNCGIKGLHVPLMAFIDYRGFRLMAMSLLPISKKTLIYGSCDAGQTVYTSNTIFNNLFANATNVINLKPHFVQDITGNIKSISGPIDIEGHIGSDNRFYLLDFARLSPPEPPKNRGAYLYKLLRLELVRKYTKPLCSDAYSPMIEIDISKHNSEVLEAYNGLIDNIIPQFSQNFQIKDEIGLNSNFDNDTLNQIFYKNENISTQLHSYGINVRYMGEVTSHCNDLRMKKYFIINCIVRTLKSLARELLRREMRKTHLPSDYPHRNLLLNFLNLLFDEFKGKTELFWTKIVCEKMEKKFQNIFLDREATAAAETSGGDKVYLNSFNILKSFMENKLTRNIILNGFCKSIGLVLTQIAVNEFENRDSFIFVDPDIGEIKTLITRLNIIDYCDGMSLYYKSMVPGLLSNSKSRLLSISKTRLETSINSMSTNYYTTLKLVNVIRLMAKYESNTTSQLELLRTGIGMLAELESKRIDENLLLLSKLNRSKSTIALTKIEGIHPENIKDAEQLINECIELSPDKAYPSYLFAKFHYVISNPRSDYSKILSYYNKIFTIEPDYQKAHIGISMFLLKTQDKHKLFSTELVSKHVTKAFSLGNLEKIVGKIKKLVNFNPWIPFESSRSVPKLRSMVKYALEKMIIDKGGKLIVPADLTLFGSDTFYFNYTSNNNKNGGILKKIYLDKHTNPINLEVFSISQSVDQIESLVLRNSSFTDSMLFDNIIKKFSNLTSINLGFSENINDEHIIMVATKNLKKLKLYEIQTITDKSVTHISKTCNELEVLDLGGCKLIGNSGDVAQNLIGGCPLIKKLGLPQCINDNDLLLLLKGLPLVCLDLMKCNNITTQVYSKSFVHCPTLKKYRSPIGTPQTMIDPQQLVSHIVQSNLREPAIKYFINKIELFNVKWGSGFNVAQQGTTYELYFNNNHPLIKFRNPNCKTIVAGFYKVAHAHFSKSPTPTLQIMKNSLIAPDQWVRDVSHNLFSSNFRFSYQGESYNFSLQMFPSHFGKEHSFSNALTLSTSSLIACIVSNHKSMGISLDLDIKLKINPIDIFLTIVTGFNK